MQADLIIQTKGLSNNVWKGIRSYDGSSRSRIELFQGKPSDLYLYDQFVRRSLIMNEV